MARVVVADNDPDALDLLVLDLRLEGHTVLGVPDAESARAAIADFGPDLVVLDHRMPPGATGLHLGVELRSTRPELPVVIYSNYQDVELVREANAHDIRFVPKGNLRTIRAAVATI